MVSQYKLSVCPRLPAEPARLVLPQHLPAAQAGTGIHFDPQDNFPDRAPDCARQHHVVVYANPYSALCFARDKGFVPVARPVKRRRRDHRGGPCRRRGASRPLTPAPRQLIIPTTSACRCWRGWGSRSGVSSSTSTMPQEGGCSRAGDLLRLQRDLGGMSATTAELPGDRRHEPYLPLLHGVARSDGRTRSSRSLRNAACGVARRPGSKAFRPIGGRSSGADQARRQLRLHLRAAVPPR